MPKRRTTLLLEPSLVQAAQKALGSSTITETVERSMEEFLSNRRRELLRQRLGTFDLDLDLKKLRRMRRHG